MISATPSSGISETVWRSVAAAWRAGITTMTFTAAEGESPPWAGLSLRVSAPASVTTCFDIDGPAATQRDFDQRQDCRHGEERCARNEGGESGTALHDHRARRRASERLIQVQISGQRSDQA